MKTFFLMSSEQKQKVVEYILLRTNQKLGVRKIARETHTSPALVVHAFKQLKNAAGPYLDFSSPFIRALKIYLNMEKLVKVNAVKILESAGLQANSIGIYGSWSNGTNYIDSDLDIWVKVETKPRENALLIARREFKNKLSADANILVLNSKDLQRLREKDFVFYCQLVNSFILKGESFD